MENTNIEKLTWGEAFDRMCEFNKQNGYTVKGTKTHLTAIAVITPDSFVTEYTEEERSYKFTSDNKAFLPNNIGTSIFSDCLDGEDIGVRLDYYVPDIWGVEYCYFVEE